MDRLARNAMLAKQAGLSYGQWKAMQPRVDIEKPAIPEDWKMCAYCGEAFAPVRKKRFCSVECREKSYKARKGKKVK